MNRKPVYLFLFFAVIIMCGLVFDVGAVSKPIIQTENLSVTTLCAEEDNINIPFSGKITSFVIEAKHPVYLIPEDNCEADFTNCNTPTGQTYPFDPGVFKLFDNGIMVVEAVREKSWWLPNGMDFSVDNGTPVKNVHYIRLYKKIDGVNMWPQFLVIYMDGNVRLIPQPPTGVSSVCFGSSVIVGPTVISSRPFAEIASAAYFSTSNTIELHYKSGGTATIGLLEVSRTVSKVLVRVNYPTDTLPFAVFRSMFVSTGNSDVEDVSWENVFGSTQNDGIMKYSGGPGREWFFSRPTISKHNTSAPDIKLMGVALKKFIGAWPDGVYTWDKASNKWTKITSTSNALMIASGKIDTDNVDDLIGVWSSGLYLQQSSNGQWIKLSSSLPTWIATGDLNNDGRDDVIGTWAGDGTYYRDSATGKWVKLTTPAKQFGSGNIGGMRDDLTGVWSDGLWVRYSAGPSWQKLESQMPAWIAIGDMTGDKRADIVGSYSTGTWYRNSATGAWTKLTTSAEQVAVGDLDGDGRDDLIGIWSGKVYVRYGATGQWQIITTSKPTWIATGNVTTATQAANGSVVGSVTDISDTGPGGKAFEPASNNAE